MRERPPFLLFLAGFFWLRRLERRPAVWAGESAAASLGPEDEAAASAFALLIKASAASNKVDAPSVCPPLIILLLLLFLRLTILLIVSYTYSQYFILTILRINSSRFSTPSRGTRFLPNIHASTHPLRGKSAKCSSQSFHSGCFFICSFTINGVPHGGPQCAKNDIWRMDALSATFAS